MLLEAKGLTAGYGKRPVLHGVDLSVDEGEMVALLGHNGAGKTTALRAIFGVIRPTAGEVRLHGSDAGWRSTSESVRAGVAFVPQGRNVFGTLTVLQNLHLGAYRIEGPDRRRLIEERCEKVFRLFPILAERRRQLAGTMSGGQQQMLALGMALMSNPRLLLLDEPSIGLAPVLVKRVLESVQDINREFGTAVLLVEQSVRDALRITRRAYVMKLGRIAYAGDSAELLERGELWHLF